MRPVCVSTQVLLGNALQQFVTLRERRQEYEVLELIESLEKLKHTYERESTRSHTIRKILVRPRGAESAPRTIHELAIVAGAGQRAKLAYQLNEELTTTFRTRRAAAWWPWS